VIQMCTIKHLAQGVGEGPQEPRHRTVREVHELRRVLSAGSLGGEGKGTV